MERRWYGWQTLIADGAWILILSLGSSAKGQAASELGVVAVADYFFAAPSIHFAHDHVGKGFGSLGLRVAPFALALGILGAGTAQHGESTFGDLSAAAVILFLGVITAVVVDTAVLANEDVPGPSTMFGIPVRFVPKAALKQGGGTLGLAVEF